MSHVSARQSYHLEPPRGLLNDPNGLAHFNEKYYVFFQWNRFAKDHTSKEWGWFESSDLVRWDFLGTALVPSQSYDRDGVLSGSAAEGDEGLFLYYTGKEKVNGRRRVRQCAALMSDGRHARKLGPVIEMEDAFTEHFRDPSVRRLPDGGYLMLLGAQRAEDGKGSIVSYRSDDGLSWEFADEFARSADYEMIECPELVRLPEGDVLLFCPQERDNARDVCGDSFAAYKVVALDEESCTLADAGARDLDHGWSLVDAGFDLYSPQTLAAPDGRRLLFGWMSRLSEEQERLLAEGEQSIHCLTLPREISLVDGLLCQVPARELRELLGGVVGPARAVGESLSFAPAARAYHVSVRMEEARSFSLELNGGEAVLSYDGGAGALTLLRADWATGATERREVKVGALTDLEVWLDQSSLEAFANHGAATLSARMLPRSEFGHVSACGFEEGCIEVRDIVAPQA